MGDQSWIFFLPQGLTQEMGAFRAFIGHLTGIMGREEGRTCNKSSAQPQMFLF